MGLNVCVAVVAGLTALTMTSQGALATDSLLDGHEALIASNAGIAAPTGALTLSTTATQETDAATTQAEEDMDIFPAAAAPRFGEKGSRRFHIHGGYGVDVKDSDTTQGLAGVGISYFVDDNISLDVEFNGMYIDQTGGTAAAFNFNLLIRWHFHAEDTWSLYVDGGAGLFLADDDVPEAGSTFNFTPQAGFGASFDVGNDARLMTGIRWHHISNASLYDENPGRDSIMAYVGVSLPF